MCFFIHLYIYGVVSGLEVLIFITFQLISFALYVISSFCSLCMNNILTSISQKGIGGVIVWWAKRKYFLRDFLYSFSFQIYIFLCTLHISPSNCVWKLIEENIFFMFTFTVWMFICMFTISCYPFSNVNMNMLYNTPSDWLFVYLSVYESVYTFGNTKFICLSYKTPHQKPAPFSFLPISLNRALQA